MTVAEIIKKTRIDSEMTQEEYGNKFGVTRQTVSSWENEKSTPDLQMLISICKTYKISLDLLLNSDKRYVNQVDRSLKFNTLLKKCLIILCIVCCFYVILFGIWKIYEKRENKRFNTNVTEMGFEFKDGIFVMKKGNIVYNLPNQKLPFLKFHFDADYITVICTAEQQTYKITLTGNDGSYIFSIDYGIENDIEGIASADGDIEYTDCSDNQFINKYDTSVRKEILNMIKYYNIAYK